jgi:hypothetical protein
MHAANPGIPRPRDKNYKEHPVKAPLKLFAPVLAALAIAACNAGGNSSLPATTSQLSIQRLSEPYWKATGEATQVCPDAPRGYATCDVLLVNKMRPNTTIGGWKPADFQAAYNLPSKGGSGQIVAIVDAFDNPDATSDLAVYRKEFGLGTAKFTKYNQTGEKKDYPTACTSGSQGQRSWCLEDDLDIEMVSAVCPKCTIYLVEANGADTNDLQTAEAEAVTLGAHIVSNSWGCTGSNDCLATSYFDKKGVLYLASGGDDGYGTQAPAALASVVAVGGTVLTKNSSDVYSEAVWPGSGSGCATGVTKPAWQKDPKCSSRTMDDVSAVSTDVAEYDTAYGTGWTIVEGTSIGSPLLSGVFGLAGNADKQNAGEAFWKLKKKAIKKELHDITSGEVSGCPPSLDGTYLCEAGTGEFGQYAAPIGWGTPDGIKAF